jgi:hypothetical protein
MSSGRIVVLARLVVASFGSAMIAPAHAERQAAINYSGSSAKALGGIVISGNSGGKIIHFALKVAQARQSRTLVRFAGRCDSACTLYLGLPSRQVCISEGAYFRFHAPVGRTARASAAARKYLMRKYPGWVRAFLARHNGLTNRLVTMDYSYARRFIKPCETRTASR